MSNTNFSRHQDGQRPQHWVKLAGCYNVTEEGAEDGRNGRLIPMPGKVPMYC